VIKLKQMTIFYDVPGEAGYFMNGEDYGFNALSFLLTGHCEKRAALLGCAVLTIIE
jgi:hypothetical protein